jgi:hypothetical protein
VGLEFGAAGFGGAAQNLIMSSPLQPGPHLFDDEQDTGHHAQNAKCDGDCFKEPFSGEFSIADSFAAAIAN